MTETNNEVKDFKYYYRYLLKTFGGSNYLGCRALAYVLLNYKDNTTNINKLYADYAEDISSTPSAVERSVRVYLKHITKEYSMEDLTVMLDYAFKLEDKNLKATEFIPVLKLALDD